MGAASALTVPAAPRAEAALRRPSLAAAALGATPERLLADLELELLGCLFESLVYRELTVYSRACDATVYHYRDNTGLEVDAVVEDRRGDWFAFKFGGAPAPLGAAPAAGSPPDSRADRWYLPDRPSLQRCGYRPPPDCSLRRIDGYRRQTPGTW